MSATWFGGLPESWQAAPLKRVATFTAGGTPDTDEPEYWCDPDDGIPDGIPWVAIGDMSRVSLVTTTERAVTGAGRRSKSLTVAPAGSILFAMYASVGATSVLGVDAAFNQALLALAPMEGVEPRHVRYALEAIRPHLSGMVRSNTQDNLNASQVANLLIPLPSVDQQREVADFLDRETAQIDAMIEAQQHLVYRLEERRRAMFAHEVQARVNCGERLKWWLFESDTRADDLAVELPLLSVSIDWGVRKRDETISQSASEDLTKYKVVRRGGVVVNRMRAFQGALGRAPEDGIVSPDYSVFRCSPSVDSEWLVAIMRSSPFVSEMANRIRGIGSPDAGQVRTPRINANDLLDIRVEIPDLDTQRAEMARWRRRAGQMSRLVEASRDSIALMHERRAALISATVTGRIDPRTGKEVTREMVLESA